MAHIGILSANQPGQYEDGQPRRVPESITGCDRIFDVGSRRGHTVTRFFEPRFTFLWGDGEVLPLYDGIPFEGCDALIYRPNFIEEPSLHIHAPTLLRAFGIPVLNGGKDAVDVKNKLMQHVKLAESGAPMPGWAIAESVEAAIGAAERIGFPLIVKVAFGARGKGVFFTDQMRTFMPIVDYLSVRDGNPVLIEECIPTPDHRDVRVFVVGARVIAAMERVAHPRDMRANAAVGGTGCAAVLSDVEERIAIQAAETFSLDIAGVDLIRSERGTLVLEVNANPGFHELESCTGIDVAAAIIDHAEAVVQTKAGTR